MTAPSEVLGKALELLEDGGWTQGGFARNESGELLGSACDAEAVSWCAWGAIHAAADLLHTRPYDADELLRDTIGTTHIPSWNDAPERTFSEVQQVFRRAAYSGGGSATKETSLVACGE